MCSIWQRVASKDVFHWRMCLIGECISLENMFPGESVPFDNVLHRKMCFIGECVSLETVLHWRKCFIGECVSLENMFTGECVPLENTFIRECVSSENILIVECDLLENVFHWRMCSVGSSRSHLQILKSQPATQSTILWYSEVCAIAILWEKWRMVQLPFLIYGTKSVWRPYLWYFEWRADHG